MGLPIWTPKSEQLSEHGLQQQQQQQCKRHSPPKPQHSSPNYRLHRNEQRTASFPYYLASDPYQPMLHPLTTEQPPSFISQQQEQQQMEQRLNEKQELLDQLNITISLLDQFLSIRDLSGQENAALPPFITDDLLAILTATSATLNTNTRSYDHRGPSSSNNSTRSITTTTSSRLADLESSIVSAHHRVSDRLNLLGAILPVPSPR